jgi:hypothetical protein
MNKYACLFAFVLFTGCAVESREDIFEYSIEGNWYTFDVDSIYHELYFSKEFMLVNSDDFDSRHLSKYIIKKDSVFVDGDFYFKIISQGDGERVIMVNDSEKFVLRQLDLNFSPFDHVILSDIIFDSLINYRMERKVMARSR